MGNTLRAPCSAWWLRLLLVLGSAELGLQLWALGYRAWATHARQTQQPNAPLTILCLGDSHTFGIGADAAHSYPRQLEGLLQAQWPAQAIRVVNAGVPGFNSSQVLHRLEGHLREAQPDLVLVLVGLNDWISFQEVDLTTVEALRTPWLTRWKIRLDQWLSHVRLFRLGKLAFLRQQAWGGAARARPDASLTVASSESILAGLRELIQHRPQVARWFLQPAGEEPETLTDQDLHTQALRLAQEAWQSAQGEIGTLERLGTLFRRDGREDLALQVYQRVLDLHYEDPKALPVLATVYLMRREMDRAQAVYEQLIRQDPTDPRGYLGLGWIFLRKVPEQAITSARTALALDPRLAEAYFLLGHTFRRQQAFDQAQAMFLQAVQLDPSMTLYWLLLARGYGDVGQVELARQALREAFRQAHDLTALGSFGHTYTDPVEARQAIQALLEESQAAAPQTDPAYWRRLHDFSVFPQRLLEANLEQMIDQMTTAGVRIGLLTYPSLTKESLVNQTIREVAAGHSAVLLIDATQALAERFADPTHALLASDHHHPNAKGYELVAGHVLEALMAAGVLGAPSQIQE